MLSEDLNNLSSIGDKMELIKVMCLGRYANTPLHPGTNLTFSDMLNSSQIQTTSSVEEAEAVVSCDFLQSEVPLISSLKFSIQRKILVFMEPEVVIPINFGKQIEDKFGTVIRVGRPGITSDKNLRWPQKWRDVAPLNLNRGITEIAMICGNKISFVKGEMYSLRRRAAFEIEQIALYGSEWDSLNSTRMKKMIVEIASSLRAGYLPNLKSLRYWFAEKNDWRGAPADKAKVLEQFKVSLVIENSLEFLSEKLFDSFFAGCIPVYVGPDLEDFEIPGSLVISVSPDIPSIRAGISQAIEMDYQKWHSDLSAWLGRSEIKRQWSSEGFFTDLSRIIVNSVSKIGLTEIN